MSLRNRFVAVRSVDGLRRVIASKDSALHAKLTQRYGQILADDYGEAADLDEDEAEELEEHRKAIATALDLILMSEQPPAVEDGDWSGAFELIAELTGQCVRGKFPVDSYKHLHSWGPYRKRVSLQVPPDVDELLAHLEHGRPLLGTSMESGWAMYAWLDRDEIARLHDCLEGVAIGDADGSGLVEFHGALIASLKVLRKKRAE